MEELFSRRHRDAIKLKRLQPSFPTRLRVALRLIVSEHSSFTPSLHRAEVLLRKFYGQDRFIVRDLDSGEGIECGLCELVEKGYPLQVLDALEAWFQTQPPEARDAEAEMNAAFARWDSPWRVINGRAMLMDSGYLQEEVVAGTLKLLGETGAQGALEEFETAVQQLRGGDTKDAIVNAHKSVESVMKVVLGFGQLLEALIQSGLLPDYYDSFFKNFRELVLGASKERNRPAGAHGQGRDQKEVPPRLAEFAVHLAGSINRFLLSAWLEKKGEEAGPERHPVEDDVPF